MSSLPASNNAERSKAMLLQQLMGSHCCSCCCTGSVELDDFEFFEGPMLDEHSRTKTQWREKFSDTATRKQPSMLLVAGGSASKPAVPAAIAAIAGGGQDKNSSPRNVIAKGQKRFEKQRTLPAQPDSEVLSERVICILGKNPSPFTLNGTNCYLVGTGKARLLIDTSDQRKAPLMVKTLKRVMREVGCTSLAAILITHMHFDHYGGVEALHREFGHTIPVYKYPLFMGSSLAQHFLQEVREADIEQYLMDSETGRPKWDFTSPDDGKTPELRFQELLELAESAQFQMNWDRYNRTRDEVIREYAFNRSRELFEEYLRSTGTMRAVPPPNSTIQVEGATLRALHTPGHAPDHISFVLEEEGSIFSGDNVLGFGTTFINRLYEYMQSLHIMRDLQPPRLYPGHGPVIEDGTGYLTRYIDHRNQRENQLRDYFENPEHIGKPVPAKDITCVKAWPACKFWLLHALGHEC
eukprot:INCI14993.15.p1 GENE.INCI14993.15~~INCI14993.15.p1  ORF type:complete len:467 (-),score=78.24 INCI14993.15:46-1446(-)